MIEDSNDQIVLLKEESLDELLCEGIQQQLTEEDIQEILGQLKHKSTKKESRVREYTFMRFGDETKVMMESKHRKNRKQTAYDNLMGTYKLKR